MTLRRLRFFAITTPLVLTIAFELVRALVLEPRFPMHYANVVAGTTTVGGVLLFSLIVFRAIERAHRRVVEQSLELAQKAEYTAILEERNRIAREMHDSLAQVLACLALKARALHSTLAPDRIALAQQELDEMAVIADDAYNDVREAIHGLRSSTASGAGLDWALSHYVDTFKRQSGIATRLIMPAGRVPQFAPAVEVQLVRIVQEALTNVRKHSGALEAAVRVEAEDGRARISIEDNGCGFDPSCAGSPANRFGLQTMAERAERIGGRLVVDSAPNSGARVSIELPLEHMERRDGADQAR